jgi:hypothetical protein
MDDTIFDDEMTQGDVHKENKDGEQAEEQTEIIDVEIEKRQEKQTEEECSEKIEQNSNNNSVNYSGENPKGQSNRKNGKSGSNKVIANETRRKATTQYWAK